MIFLVLFKVFQAMFDRIINRVRDKRMLKSDGVKTSVNYCVIVNNENMQYFDDYKSALDFLEHYRVSNQIFNLSVFRVECYSLVSNLINS